MPTDRPLRRRGGRRVAAIAVCVLLGLAACGDDDGVATAGADATDREPGGEPTGDTLADGRDRMDITTDGGLPDDSLRDWVSFADAVVVLHVTEEEAHPARRELLEEVGEATSLRTLDVTVDRVLWHRPGGPSAPDRFSFETYDQHVVGVEDEVAVPIHVPPAARLEVGAGSYLAPIVELPDEGWVLYASDITYRLDGDRLVPPDEPDGRVFAMDLEGTSVGELEELLATVEPHPVAAENPDLDPEARAEAAQAEG